MRLDLQKSAAVRTSLCCCCSVKGLVQTLLSNYPQSAVVVLVVVVVVVVDYSIHYSEDSPLQTPPKPIALL